MRNKLLFLLLGIVIVIVFLATFSVKNLDRIYYWKANQEFKKNNIEQAQYYFEKAFALGLDDVKAKNIYINTIVNSPFDVDAQNKLLNFLENSVNDSAKIKAGDFLDSYKQEIFDKYPDNFISQTVYNKKVLHWGSFPITYSFTNMDKVPPYFINEIEAAITEWENKTDNFLRFERVNSDANILIKFNNEKPKDNKDSKFIVAYTSPIIELGKLSRMDISFYLKDPDGKFYSQNQVYNTALHELAHALGFMGHSNNPDHVMYLTKDMMSVENDLREELTTADINTIKLLYKIKPEITNCNSDAWEYSPSLILGNEEVINNAKIKEAKTYIKNAPKIAAGYMDLAEAYVSSQEYFKALKSLDRALFFANTDELKEMIYYNFAVTYYLLEHNDLALEYLEKSIELKDTDEKHYLLADLYRRQDRIEDAIDEYENLIAKNPCNIEYTLSLTNLYVTQKKYFSARKVLKNYAKANPEDKSNPRFESYGILRLGL